ncbi:hypothetical protein DFH06DRAFT_1430901 [Mycena polygramma]|nr:hypothetical protein DFH06DRAFT_1430901 [Mycena polygramma]
MTHPSSFGLDSSPSDVPSRGHSVVVLHGARGANIDLQALQRPSSLPTLCNVVRVTLHKDYLSRRRVNKFRIPGCQFPPRIFYATPLASPFLQHLPLASNPSRAMSSLTRYSQSATRAPRHRVSTSGHAHSFWTPLTGSSCSSPYFTHSLPRSLSFPPHGVFFLRRSRLFWARIAFLPCPANAITATALPPFVGGVGFASDTPFAPPVVLLPCNSHACRRPSRRIRPPLAQLLRPPLGAGRRFGEIAHPAPDKLIFRISSSSSHTPLHSSSDPIIARVPTRTRCSSALRAFFDVGVLGGPTAPPRFPIDSRPSALLRPGASACSVARAASPHIRSALGNRLPSRAALSRGPPLLLAFFADVMSGSSKALPSSVCVLRAAPPYARSVLAVVISETRIPVGEDDLNFAPRLCSYRTDSASSITLRLGPSLPAAARCCRRFGRCHLATTAIPIIRARDTFDCPPYSLPVFRARAAPPASRVPTHTRTRARTRTRTRTSRCKFLTRSRPSAFCDSGHPLVSSRTQLPLPTARGRPLFVLERIPVAGVNIDFPLRLYLERGCPRSDIIIALVPIYSRYSAMLQAFSSTSYAAQPLTVRAVLLVGASRGSSLPPSGDGGRRGRTSEYWLRALDIARTPLTLEIALLCLAPAVPGRS